MKAIDQQIEQLEARLKALKRLRKSIRSRERMHANRANRAYMATQKARHAEMMADPERNEVRRQKMREAFIKIDPRAVPLAGGSRNPVYKHLRRYGVSREDAILEASK